METSTYLSCDGIPWQATPVCLSLHYRDKLLAAIGETDIIHERPPKKLTEEAVCMICVLLVFLGLAVLGSSVTFYEFLFQNNKKKCETRSKDDKEEMAITKMNVRNSKEKNSSESKDFMEDLKSFLKCFCMVRNARQILNTASTSETISCFQGLRFLSNIWVILFHSTYAYIGMLRQVEELKPVLDWRASQLLLNAGFAVDMFFVMSGFLNAKAFFNKYNRSNGNIPWFHFYFKRFLRLTPVYMIVIGFYTTLFSYTGTGVLWPTYDTNPACRRDWWRYPLYINNFQTSDKQCLPIFWYMAVDMQFYIISPIFMISLIRWTQLGYAVNLACICGSSIICFVLTYYFNTMEEGLIRFEFHMTDLKNYAIKIWEFIDIVHQKPYTKITPYLVGILLAYYFLNKNVNYMTARNNKMTIFCGWLVTSLFMWFLFEFLYKRQEVLIETAFYNGTKHLLFSCGFTWILCQCLTGQLEFLNKFLSWKFFLPLSRLSYCAYLIHLLIIIRFSLQCQDFIDFSYVSTVWFLSYVCGFTYFVSFFVSMLFEIPVINLLYWFSQKKVKKT